jgi:VanZ family protein
VIWKLRHGTLALVLLAVVAILAATLPPAPPSDAGPWFCLLCGVRPVAHALLNVLLFVPLGLALRAHGRAGQEAVALGSIVALAVEAAQTVIPGRTANIGDVLLNIAGAWSGSLAFGLPRRWSGLPAPLVGVHALGSALVVTGVLALTGFLLAPSFPPTAYFGGWTPDLGHLEPYRGRILDASLDDVALAPGRMTASATVRDRLSAGAPLHVRMLAGPPPSGLSPLITIHDESLDEILLLGVERNDLVYRVRTRAAAIGLDAPDTRLAGALRDVEPGAALSLKVTRHPRDLCIEVNGSPTCGLGFTLGAGWALLVYSYVPAAFGHGPLTVIWMAALFLPVGFWSRRIFPSMLAVTLLGMALWLLPRGLGLAASSTAEFAGACGGYLAGATLGARVLTGSRPAGLP